MFKRIDRYILREIIPPFLLGLLAYTFVLLMNQILLYAEIFIARGVSFQAVLHLLLYLIPSVLAFTIPMAVLLGILAGLSRMSSDSEITALKTLGVRNRRLLRPLLLFAVAGFIVTSAFTLFLAPRSNFLFVETYAQAVLEKVQFRINPRQFNESLPDTVIYFQELGDNGAWEDVFIHIADAPDKHRIILAREGRLDYFSEERRAMLNLTEGVIHSYPPADPEAYSMTFFGSFQENIDISDIIQPIKRRKRAREKDIRELFAEVEVLKAETAALASDPAQLPQYQRQMRNYRAHRVEIHKKIAIPFSCFIFAILGLNLGAFTRKGGRTSGFTVSIFLILIYYIIITAGDQMAIDGRIEPWLGMWIGNILFTVGAGISYVVSHRELSFSSLFSRSRSRKSPKVIRAAEGVGGRSLLPDLRFPNILDRYVFRRFFWIFTMAFFSMVAIFFIVSFFERIDSIYETQKPVGLLLSHIGYMIPGFMIQALPVSGLIAALLSLGIMSKFNEITAMKACGISLYRAVLPILLMGLLVSLFSFYLQDNVVPVTNRKSEEYFEKIHDIPPRSHVFLDRRWVMGKDRDRIYYYRHFEPMTASFTQISLFDLDRSNWALKRRIYADQATLREKDLNLSNTWERRFTEGRPVTFQKAETTILPISEGTDFFIQARPETDEMNFAQLRAYIKDIEEKNFDSNRYRLNLQSKLAFPLAAFIMTLLGIPFSFSMGKRGALFGMGLGLLIAMVYWGALGIFKSLGMVKALSPFLAAWGPNILFGLVGIYLLLTVRT
jgi:LPS export ABC transporter permease LptG/LPS export ABC transporter permease LptF